MSQRHFTWTTTLAVVSLMIIGFVIIPTVDYFYGGKIGLIFRANLTSVYGLFAVLLPIALSLYALVSLVRYLRVRERR